MGSPLSLAKPGAVSASENSTTFSYLPPRDYLPWEPNEACTSNSMARQSPILPPAYFFIVLSIALFIRQLFVALLYLSLYALPLLSPSLLP